MIRTLLTIISFSCLLQTTVAQSPKRLSERQQQARKSSEELTLRARLSYPKESPMQEDVVWRRDVYRELDLTQAANGGLYYPVEPSGNDMNLFTYIFKLFMRGSIPVYEYRLDGAEVFDDSAVVKRREFLDNHHIYYERTDRGAHIDDSDIPSRDVKSYYVKETSYFDQTTGTFHTRVLALCPVMSRDDDFSFTPSKYPLFWVKYDDLAPYLGKRTVMTSNVNNAATMSMDDYFTTNSYRGKIYKTNNMLGRTLAQYCPTDSAMAREQNRIESEIIAFEKNMWGDAVRKDSIDNVVTGNQKQSKRTGTSRTVRTSTTRVNRRARQSSKSAQSPARISVRRERH